LRAGGVPVDRVELVGEAPTSPARLALYNKVDVALDMYPFADAAGTCDALAMGVPVVTLAGETHASRASASVLTAAGIADTVAPDATMYVSIATTLARAGVRPLDQRSALRDAVRASPLCDEPRFAKKLEDAYRRMWERFCET
jgi:predicted O-linked N-acetylglucosamine transferase (SPINDLY family)